MPRREYFRFTWLRPVDEQLAFIRELVTADARALSRRLSTEPWVATGPVGDDPPLLVLLRQPRACTERKAMLTCVRLLLDAGADPNSYTTSRYGDRESALLEAVEPGDLELAELLLDHGAGVDIRCFEAACVNEEFNDPDDSPMYDLLTRPWGVLHQDRRRRPR